METKNYPVRNFRLSYNGIYKVEFDNKERHIYISYRQLVRLFEKEGLDINSYNSHDWAKGIEFKKTAIIFQYIEDEDGAGFLTSEIGDYYQENNIWLLYIEIEK